MAVIDFTPFRTGYQKINGRIGTIPIIFILLSAVTFFAFMVFLILPGKHKINQIRQEIKSVSSDIKMVNENFVPAYARAKKFEEIRFEPRFPLPDRATIDRKNLSELPETFYALALEHNLQLSNKNLDLGFLKTKSTSISMFLELEGKLQDFRNYLVAVISLPFFDSFEKIKINSTQNSNKKFSVDLKINIK